MAFHDSKGYTGRRSATLNHKKDQPRFHKYVNKKVINGKERFVMTTICKLTVVNCP